ncbi:hypothetical protein [Novosphingobium sp. BW1]|uniref:hypothetical protein n=1 Tax=Novosphingobium sp. BW1 TaxID=2592621 RepID=UPI0011DE912B|nr:hypothetical protein [Novosphingobium sp. BW1]TYC92058.1 hypothetical protein FMM79_03995 [Novosphingobium sp. BW1]
MALPGQKADPAAFRRNLLAEHPHAAGLHAGAGLVVEGVDDKALEADTVRTHAKAEVDDRGIVRRRIAAFAGVDAVPIIVWQKAHEPRSIVLSLMAPARNFVSSSVGCAVTMLIAPAKVWRPK